ncbi:hypothetical protein PZS78_20320 [Pseudomonas aeruginosa]|uniref:hypothetical protein n=1 Tax=Pseudomonas aeruginosa TaxID=287 RepID=UPI002B271051|nr:hypothetical protein [Pseudomonas aeruginosa]MEA8473999.1 hypothetical protein [Pseudomonas aeruginosa]HCL4064634.1 hypothetical protein [Pseudomonas aeruginosa]
MSKHTPGPWGIERLHGEINVISCNERDGAAKDMGIVYVLARDVGGMIHGEQFDDRSEVEANARLMAAAPELLEALQGMLEVYGGQYNDDCLPKASTELELIQQARAAIAKATAQPRPCA